MRISPSFCPVELFSPGHVQTRLLYNGGGGATSIYPPKRCTRKVFHDLALHTRRRVSSSSCTRYSKTESSLLSLYLLFLPSSPTTPQNAQSPSNSLSSSSFSSSHQFLFRHRRCCFTSSPPFCLVAKNERGEGKEEEEKEEARSGILMSTVPRELRGGREEKQ